MILHIIIYIICKLLLEFYTVETRKSYQLQKPSLITQRLIFDIFIIQPMWEEGQNPVIEEVPEEAVNENDLICEGSKTQGRWSDEEHYLFLLGVFQFGKDWKLVEGVVKTRTGTQVRSHAQKYFIKLRKQQKERKKSKNKTFLGPTELESQILRRFTQTDVTNFTPHEFVQILKESSIFRRDTKEEIEHQGNLELSSSNVTYKSRKFSLERDRLYSKNTLYEQPMNDVYLGELKLSKESRLFDDFLKIRRQQGSEEQSFFVEVIKQYLPLFRNGFDFYQLCNIHRQIDDQQSQIPLKSFSLLKEKSENPQFQVMSEKFSLLSKPHSKSSSSLQ